MLIHTHPKLILAILLYWALTYVGAAPALSGDNGAGHSERKIMERENACMALGNCPGMRPTVKPETTSVYSSPIAPSPPPPSSSTQPSTTTLHPVPTLNTKRYLFNCGNETEKAIEQMAWNDHKQIAQMANVWRSDRNVFMPTIKYYMGNDAADQGFAGKIKSKSF